MNSNPWCDNNRTRDDRGASCGETAGSRVIISPNNKRRKNNLRQCSPTSAFGHSRRFRDVGYESALPPTTDIVSWTAHGRKVPKTK
jgi:hypothetical protein